jgi:non-homologous end joining protein Ku
MYTLHHAAEIRGIEQVEELNSVPAKVKPEEIKLAKQVIETFDARRTCPITATKDPGDTSALV